MFSWSDYSYTNWIDSILAELRAKGFHCDPQPFFYASDFLPLGANAEQFDPIRIDTDADFALVQLMSNDPNVNVQVKLNVEGTRDLTNDWVHMANLFGTGQRPGLLYKPIILRKGMVLTVTLKDNSGAANNIRLTFGGVKLKLRPAG
jgi:hypothetical protein